MPLKSLVTVVIGVAAIVGAYMFFMSKYGPSEAEPGRGAQQTSEAGLPPANAVAANEVLPSEPSAAELALKNPMGDAPDPADPGQQHYKMGRYPEAIAYWTEQAAKGNADAAHRLGVVYMDGKREVAERDFAKALQYHRQAAMAGNALSMFDVGTIFEYGYGVAKDIVQAALWYGRSANYGLAQGQYNFGTMLEAGEGVAKDEVEAYKFFILAERGGFTGVPFNNATMRIDSKAPLPTQLIEKKLSKEQQADGLARANAFKALDGPLKVE